jgi:tetratricopeptide (TPR) repeat protein
VQHLLIFGGAALAVCLLFRGRLMGGRPKLRRRWTGPVLKILLAGFVLINVAGFARYAAGRRYSILDTSRSLKRILSDGVFMVGDCSTTLALEAGFKSLPAYGDLIRYDEKEEFEKYPVTHFLLRFPTLYEYLDRNYPEFKNQTTAVASFMLCGREATVVRFHGWPGNAAVDYSPSLFERAMDQLRGGEAAASAQLLESFLKHHPDSYIARSLLAFTRLQAGQAEEALAEARRALDLNNRDALSYEVHGDILNSLGREAEARAEWQKALKLNPGRRSLQGKLGLRRQ